MRRLILSPHMDDESMGCGACWLVTRTNAAW